MTKVFKTYWKEILLWTFVVIIVFLAGYYKGLKRLEAPFQLSKEPVRIITFDPSLFSLDLLDYLEFELQRPIEVSAVTNWGDFVSKLTSSNQIALAVYPLSWAKKAKTQDLVLSRNENEIQQIVRNIHVDFQNSNQTYYYFPWLWAQAFRISRLKLIPNYPYQLSEMLDLNCSLYPKNQRSTLKYKQENISSVSNELEFNSRVITHRLSFDPAQWEESLDKYLIEIALFEPKTTDVSNEIRLKLLVSLMTENAFDFVRSHKPFSTCVVGRKRNELETAEQISKIELKKLRTIDFCETF